MKKILLTAAIATATLFSASADLMSFSNSFTVSYNGEAVEPGATIKCTHVEDVSDLYGPDYVTYECNLDIVNLDIMPAYIKATLSYNNPTYAEHQANPFDYGDAQLCYGRSTTPGGALLGQCTLGNPPVNCGEGIEMVPAEGAGDFQWQIHLMAALNKYEETYNLTLQGTTEDGTAVTEAVTYPIFFSAKPDSGVTEIEATEGEGVWYDLQGRRVENPEKGMYIYKTAAKAVKIVVK